MRRTGAIDLPLHGGSAPRWLFGRMVKLSGAIAEAVVDEYGRQEFLDRMADPLWFQAFSCVLGFDWHSSGATTVTCGALREGLEQASLGLRLAGGKGSHSKDALRTISADAEAGLISSSIADRLARSSRLSAKVDSAAVQDGHQLYHHAIVYDDRGHWSVIQQGMCGRTGYARRYHWRSRSLESFVEEPHAGIVGTRVPAVLDMTSRRSADARKTSMDLVSEPRRKLEGLVRLASLGAQRSLLEFDEDASAHTLRAYAMPKRVDWDALARCYEFRPRSYEELLLVKGVGAGMVRALALVSQVVYGDELSWQDPVKFSFAVGGKDGVPFPVDRKSMDKATDVLRTAVSQARIGDGERRDALRRLSRHAF